MAVDKNGKTLPKGITLRSDGRYMARFQYDGERYTIYDKYEGLAGENGKHEI